MERHHVRGWMDLPQVRFTHTWDIDKGYFITAYILRILMKVISSLPTYLGYWWSLFHHCLHNSKFMEQNNSQGFSITSLIAIFSWRGITMKEVCRFLNHSIFMEGNNYEFLICPSLRMVFLSFVTSSKGLMIFS